MGVEALTVTTATEVAVTTALLAQYVKVYVLPAWHTGTLLELKPLELFATHGYCVPAMWPQVSFALTV